MLYEVITLLFTPSGFLSDRFPKQKVLRYGALAAVAGTALITVCYLNGFSLSRCTSCCGNEITIPASSKRR